MNDLNISRGETISEMKTAMMVAAGKALMPHNNDPNSWAMLLAAFAMMVDDVDKEITPGFQRMLIELLKKREAS